MTEDEKLEAIAEYISIYNCGCMGECSVKQLKDVLRDGC